MKASNLLLTDLQHDKDSGLDIIQIEIDEAMNGEEAVQLFEKNITKECQNPLCMRAYKLILMDIGMPIKDGYEASREIIQILQNLKEFMADDENIPQSKINDMNKF